MKFVTGDQNVCMVIPCRNEEQAIGPLIAEIKAQGVDEIVVVDNGSTDRTAARAVEAGANVVSEPVAGYGRGCAKGVANVGPDCDIVCFLDGDGSDMPGFIPVIAGAVASGQADFSIGSRVRGEREPGSMSPQQLVAARIAGWLLYRAYGIRFTDMSPFRAIPIETLRALGMREQTYGWNLEMQMRVAASGLRSVEIPVDHRCRNGGVSKVSRNLAAGVKAGWTIATTFLRLWRQLRPGKQQASSSRP